MARKGLGQEKRCGQIESEGAIPSLSGHLQHRQIEETAGVAHEDIQCVLGRESLFDELSRSIGLDKITGEIGRVTWNRRRLLVLQSVKHQSRASLTQAHGNGVS